MLRLLLAALVALAIVPRQALAGDPITLESLLKEMTDREAVARFPDPPYTCKQFSSYDRRSTTPDDPKTWFANGDVNQYLRMEEVPLEGSGAAGSKPAVRKEWVMADMDGPGAIVRIWSANPAGTLRIYLDGNPTPAIEAPMGDLLSGKWKVGPPLSQEVSKGWNLYLPIPYAKHCKITSDKDGFYYQVNYRTYAQDSEVESYSAGQLERLADLLHDTQEQLVRRRSPKQKLAGHSGAVLNPGKPATFDLAKGSFAVHRLAVGLMAKDQQAALRSTIISMKFDGEQTVWCPLSDFFGTGVGINAYQDRYRQVDDDGTMECMWVMPYKSDGSIQLLNLGTEAIQADLSFDAPGWQWDSRSMHFHANWHYEYPIHAYGGRGTKDWNYIEATGKGVYVGDTLAVMNPVPDWWGEGDEKIYVDGEKFPSHFGTGTEDYYGYAWCWPVCFQHPFHAQVRCDGNGKNNWGHTVLTRVRSLDAIPFTKSLKFDMEVWHWKECDVAYAATTYWYALPGATSNRKPEPEEAAKPIPQPPPLPPPFKIDGAIECEGLEVTAKSAGIQTESQDMTTFGRSKWSGDGQLWVRAFKVGDFVEVKVPVPAAAKGPQTITLYATRSWDYGTVQFTINGQKAGESIDLYSGGQGRATQSGALDLGTFEAKDGVLTLRAQVVGTNPKSQPPHYFFGLDCLVLAPAK